MQMDGWSYGADKTQGLRVFLVQFACWRFNFHKFPILIQLFFGKSTARTSSESQRLQSARRSSECIAQHSTKQSNTFHVFSDPERKCLKRLTWSTAWPWAECCTRVCAFPKPITKNSRGSNLALRPKQKQWKVSVRHSKLKERRTSLQVLAIVRDQI